MLMRALEVVSSRAVDVVSWSDSPSFANRVELVEGRGKGGRKRSREGCGGMECLKRSWHEACIIARELWVNGTLNVCAARESVSEVGIVSRSLNTLGVPKLKEAMVGYGPK